MGWDISEIESLHSAKFKFNIYSDTMKDFLFEHDIDDTTITVLVAPSTQNPKPRTVSQAWGRHEWHHSRMEALILYKLDSMKFTTWNDIYMYY